MCQKQNIHTHAVAQWAKFPSSSLGLTLVCFTNLKPHTFFSLSRCQRLWFYVMEISSCATLWPVWATTYWPVDGITRCYTSRSAKSWSNPMRPRYALKLWLAFCFSSHHFWYTYMWCPLNLLLYAFIQLLSNPVVLCTYFIFCRHKRRWRWIYRCCCCVVSPVCLMPKDQTHIKPSSLRKEQEEHRYD